MKKLILVFLFIPLIGFAQLEENIIQIQEIQTTTDAKFKFVQSRLERLKAGLIELRTKEVLNDDESYSEQTKALIADIDSLIVKYQPLFSKFDTIYKSVSEGMIEDKISEFEKEKLRLENSKEVNDKVDEKIIRLDKLIVKNKDYLKEFEIKEVIK